MEILYIEKGSTSNDFWGGYLQECPLYVILWSKDEINDVQNGGYSFMNLPNDPIMLYSVINLKLRDFYSGLDALCEDLDVDKEELVKKLAAAGFIYNAEQNQFV